MLSSAYTGLTQCGCFWGELCWILTGLCNVPALLWKGAPLRCRKQWWSACLADPWAPHRQTAPTRHLPFSNQEQSRRREFNQSTKPWHNEYLRFARWPEEGFGIGGRGAGWWDEGKNETEIGWAGRSGITHRFLLQVDCGNVEGARSRTFPVHRHHMSVVSRQSVPDSEGTRDFQPHSL